MNSKRAKLPRKACEACRSSKTRCDTLKPNCSTCQRLKRECVYNKASRTTEETQSPTHKGPASPFETRPDLMPRADNDLMSQFSFTGILMPNQFSALEHSMENTGQASSSNMVPNELGFSQISSQPWSATTSQHEWLSQMEINEEPISQPVPSLRRDYSSRSSNEPPQSDATVILRALKSGSDSESALVLAAIRLGVHVSDLAYTLAAGDDIVNLLGRQEQLSNIQSGGSEKVRIPGPAPAQPPCTPLKELQTESMSDGPLVAYASKIFDRLVWTRIKYAPTVTNRYEAIGSFIRGSADTRDKGSDAQKLAQVPVRGLGSSLTDDNHGSKMPFWSILPMRSPSQLADPFDETLKLIQAELKDGADVKKYCGKHAFVGALLDERQFRESPRLSQICAAMARSVLSDIESANITLVAIMYLQWSLWNWLLQPNKQSYEGLPETMRPTPWQLFAPHCLMYDFCIPPSLRDRLCRAPLDDNKWVTESCKTILCGWPRTLLDAITRHQSSGGLDLTAECKAHIGKPETWSLGPSMRSFFAGIDSHITIRDTDGV